MHCELTNPIHGFNILIVGLGLSGQSVAAYLSKRNIKFQIADSRINPPDIEKFKAEFEPTGLLQGVHLGAFESAVFCAPSLDLLIISPGIDIAHPLIQQAKAQGKKIIGDIELFAQAVKSYCPNHQIIGITGSNGKSTVVSLVGALLSAYANQTQTQKINIVVAGNIGLPVLTALDNLISEEPDLAHCHVYFVLELSSFQLETTESLDLTVSAILNISPNHLDRYNHNVETYAQAKHKIYALGMGDKNTIVYNRQDNRTYPDYVNKNINKNISFGLDKPQDKPEQDQWGICSENNHLFLACGQKSYSPVSDLKLMGQHNYANSLAALAILQALGLNFTENLNLKLALSLFTGLPHRCEWVANKDKVQFINDSKATSIGATIAAIEGLAPTLSLSLKKGKLILIAGGDGKGADFSEMTPILEKYVQAVVLIGRDADKIAEIVPKSIPSYLAKTLDKAVPMAYSLAKAGDMVLLSPICASWDQYSSYVERGEHFKACVRNLI